MKLYHNRKLILSGLISFMLVILALFYFLTQQSTNTSETILFTCVILFAVVMFLYSFYQRKRYERSISMLNADYKEVYTLVVDKITTSNLTSLERHHVKEDLLNMMLDAQNRDESVQSFIGNVDEFSKSIINALGGNMSLLIYEITGLQYLIGFIIFVKFADNLNQIRSLSDYFDATISYKSLLLFTLVSLITIPLIFSIYKKNVEGKLITQIGIFLGIPIFSVLSFELIVLLINSVEFNQGQSVVFDSIYGFITALLLLFVGFIIKRSISKHLLQQ